MQPSDLKEIAEIHLRAFPHFFLSQLGRQFLLCLYEEILNDASGIAMVCRADQRILGFVAGTSEPRGFFGRLLANRWPRFAWASLGPVLKNPLLLPRVLNAFRRKAEESIDPGCGLLLSIAVDPGVQASGAGTALVSEFLKECGNRGLSSVHLTTDRLANDPVNRFYSKLGFTVSRVITTPQGRPMNDYRIELSPGKRDEPIIRDAFLPFSLPDVGEEEIAEVASVLREGWLTTGPKTKQFEEDFARYMNANVEALAVNSATAGLHLALEAAGVGPGDEVITTPYTFTATAEVIRYLGAHPAFVDIQPDTLNIDPAAIEAAITDRTKALIPVHFAGLACDMQAILRIARRHHLKVIEDAAHALPATASGGHLVGTLESDATVFSFYATKTLATGEGGMIVTRDPQLAARCRMMRLHGIDRDAFGRYTSKAPAWQYRVVAPGFKYNMTDVAAAIGIHQLRKLDRFLARRTELARRYDERLRDLSLHLPEHAKPGELHAWHLYVIRLADNAPLSRDAFIEAMAECGIGTSVHFIPLHLHPYWRDTYNLAPEQFPEATKAYERVVSLPLYTKITDTDHERVIRAVRTVLGSARRDLARTVTAHQQPYEPDEVPSGVAS